MLLTCAHKPNEGTGVAGGPQKPRLVRAACHNCVAAVSSTMMKADARNIGNVVIFGRSSKVYQGSVSAMPILYRCHVRVLSVLH